MLKEKQENRVKLYGVIIGLITLALQHGIYLLGHTLAGLVGNEPFLPKIVAIDDAIPIVSIFILPYVWSYVYWAMTPMAVSKCKFDHFLNYLATYLFACLFGALILTFAPTYMDRAAEGLLDTTKTDLFTRLRQFWYTLDGTKIAYNLFPSFHCINSTVSFLGVYRRPEIPKWYRIYSLILTLTIFASTLFVKQHYFVDVVSGALIGIVAYGICMRWNAGRIFHKPIDGVRRLLGKEPLFG